jgi:hypothetical protein
MIPVPATSSAATSEGPAASAAAGPPARSLRRRVVDATATTLSRWWMFTQRPMSLRVAWQLTGTVEARPARVLLFVLLTILPTVFNAPLLACTGPMGRGAAEPNDAPDDAIGRKLAAWRTKVSRSWPVVTRPMGRRAAWRASDRVGDRPGDSPFFASLWLASNLIDRPVLYAASYLAPTLLVGPILWCLIRPTRRWGLYLITFIVLIVGG